MELPGLEAALRVSAGEQRVTVKSQGGTVYQFKLYGNGTLRLHQMDKSKSFLGTDNFTFS